jgi:hypothetical protein
MINAWDSETIDGADYDCYFKGKGDKRVVQVHEITSKHRTGPTTERVISNALPLETRDLPLDRQEALSFVQRYLWDLHPETKKRVVERLCAVGDSPEFRSI